LLQYPTLLQNGAKLNGVNNMNKIVENITSKIKNKGLQIEISEIENVLVLENEGSIPLPVDADWISDQVKNDEDFDNILENYQEISKHLFERGRTDFVWAATNDNFVHANNFEACKKCMEIISSLDNPADHGWINFIILCERNREYDLAIKIAEKAYEKFKTPKYVALLTFELVQFGSESASTKIIDELLQIPISDFDQRALNYSNDTSWNLMTKGKFLKAKEILQKIIVVNESFHLLINLGHCFMFENNVVEALNNYQKAKEINRGSILHDFDNDQNSLDQWITNIELWETVRKELE
jgi:tetratricopeptide (TPR) repeat protein